MEKMLYGKYKIIDCEHYGDIDSGLHDLERYNVNIIDTYWDGRDCGEAYIKFSFAEKDFEEIYRALHSFAIFEDNIQNYVQVDRSWAEGLPFPILEEREFLLTQRNCRQDISEGFERRLPLYITFDAEGIDHPKPIIEEFLKLLPHPRKINRVAASLLDYFESPHYGFLITSDLKNLNEEFMAASKRFFVERLLYGYCKIDHLYNRRYHHDLPRAVAERVQQLKAQQSQQEPTNRPQRSRMRR